MNKEQVLTRAGFRALSEELERLRTRREFLISELADIDDYPTDTEAATFQRIREREEVESRMNYIRQQLSNAKIADGTEDSDKIHVGSRVTVCNFDRQDWLVFDIVGTLGEETDKKAVTQDSPVGKALLNKSVGDTIHIETPDGQDTYRVMKINEMPSAKG